MTARAWAPIVGVIVIVLIVSITYLILNRRKNRQENLKEGRPLRGDLSRLNEQALMSQIDAAHRVLTEMAGFEISYGVDASYLSDTHRKMIEDWQSGYAKLNDKIGWIRSS